MIDEAVMHKNEVGIVSTVSAGGSARQPVAEGAVAASGGNPCA